MREAETERVAKLRDAFLQGLIQGEVCLFSTNFFSITKASALKIVLNRVE